MKTFLHVGCGPKRKDRTTAGFADWNELRFDIDESVQPDLVGTMTDMSSVSTESVDAVLSSHNIEHLYPHEVPVALSEFLRVLEPVVGLAKEEVADCGCSNFERPLKPLAVHQFTNCSSKRKTLHMLGVIEL